VFGLMLSGCGSASFLEPSLMRLTGRYSIEPGGWRSNWELGNLRWMKRTRGVQGPF
jgi:hypothetical protein